jgi:hypothetical protein
MACAPKLLYFAPFESIGLRFALVRHCNELTATEVDAIILFLSTNLELLWYVGCTPETRNSK